MNNLVDWDFLIARYMPHHTGRSPLRRWRSHVELEPGRGLSEGSQFGEGESMLHAVPAGNAGRREVYGDSFAYGCDS